MDSAAGSETEAGDDGATAPRAAFSVDHLPEPQRYEVWRDSISCIFEVDRPKEEKRETFNATLEASLLGSVMLARTRTLRQTWHRSSALIARDGMDHYMIQLYESGALQIDGRGRSVEIPRNGLVVFDLAQEALCHTNDFCNISMIVPRPMLEGLIRAPDDQHLRVLTADEPLVSVLYQHMLTLERHTDRLAPRESTAVAPASVGLAAACLNANVEATEGGARSVSHALLTTAKAHVEANLAAEGLTPDSVARHLGVSRAKLYDIFAPFDGIAAYIRERRLRRALAMLLDPAHGHLPAYRIGLEVGFGDETSFSRAFRQRFGFPPGEARRQGRYAETAAEDLTEGLDRRYETWLNQLA